MMQVQEPGGDSQNMFADQDLETGKSSTVSDTKPKKSKVFSPEASAFCFSIGIGFFCSIYYANILVAPLLLGNNFRSDFSIKVFVIKIACFALAYIFAMFLFNSSVASFLFLCFTYVPYFSNL